MAVKIAHSRYAARIALEVVPEHLALPAETQGPWWADGTTFSHRGVDLPVHRYMEGKRVSYFLFLDELPPRRLLIDYLVDLRKASSRMPEGGIVFIDQATHDLVETNWDLGETEEWAEILESLLSTGSVLHTFSATDAAIEMRCTAEGTTLQNLNWEAIPDRLETSRLMEPVHIFEDQSRFVAQVQECLAQLSALWAEAQALTDDCKSTILTYLSVEHRVKTWPWRNDVP